MSKIKITILGTTAGVPTRERAHTAIHISYDDGVESCMLFDCGEGTQRQFLFAGLNMMKLDDVFITHWHGDHCLGIPGMVDTMGFEDRKRPLTIYAPEVRRVGKCIAASRSMSKFKVESRAVPSRGTRITTVMQAERFSVKSIPVSHGVPAVAYGIFEKDKTGIDKEKAARLGLPDKGEIYRKLKETGSLVIDGRKLLLEDVARVERGKKVVYSGDTEICDNLKRLAEGSDLLVQDCTYFEDTDGDKPHKHASLPEVMEMIAECSVKKVVLTHVSRKHQDTSFLKEVIAKYNNVQLAEDFTEIVV